jgi:hypothetical protein
MGEHYPIVFQALTFAAARVVPLSPCPLSACPLKAAGLDWITALRAPAIKQLLNSGALQLTLFDQRDMASIAKEPFSCPGLTFPRQPRGAAVATPRTGPGAFACRA